MKKIVFFLFFLFICVSPSRAQHYIAPSLGYGIAFFESDDLELFTNTYNQANIILGFGLSATMGGFNQPVGFRAELGYRYFGKLAAFANFGYQNLLSKDFAQFDSGAKRDFTLKQNGLYFEGGIGPYFKKLFLAGTMAIFFNKKLALETSYSVAQDEGQTLTGTYIGSSSLAADIGLAFGVHKEPVVLSAKITYPLFSGSGTGVLTDNKPVKVSAGTSVFPSNYWDYLDSELSHTGISENIDGLKIMVTLSFLFKVKDLAEVEE